MDEDRFKSVIKNGLEKFGINNDNLEIKKLWNYMNLLLEENQKYNLTNITEPENIITKHFFDSLAPFLEVNPPLSKKILDMGTGPGFPGMVWKIFFPKNEFVLVDSTLKKINFLKMVSARLKLYNNLEILHERAEDLADKKEYREKFDLVLSRAVAPLNVLAEYTVPFVKEDGLLYYYKGPNYKEELDKSSRSFKILGGELDKIKRLEIPGLAGERYLLIYKKTRSTPEKYPRRAGIPKKRPL